ncbi:putative membrane protein [Albidovulum inexpectatum]|uniref:Putative membrane protein n=1 Tax=Albidovulum inexpectatum TaxID=196587 RepID=A0A2S5JIW0_9RHOB|nr:DUF2244 domain-containing protein [Albidovulum inexpectatum]PPB81185.1 putative membrane protein [Albidovulum inexpectatum]
MPYEWVTGQPERGKPAELHLWPYRSLPRKGFAAFIALTAGLLALPLIAALGTLVFWGLLPFLLAAIWGLWHAISRSYRSGEVIEVLRIDDDRAELIRRDPDGREHRWQANPYWVRVQIYPTGGPVEHYVTLKGQGREVEIGAFLSEDERKALAEELRAAFAAHR